MYELAVNDIETAARRLLGAHFVRTWSDGAQSIVKIVETEAYDESDPASHSFRGPNMRNEAMFMKAGTLYVYLIYGVHYCMNVVTGVEGHGSGVLIRAVEPVTGIEMLQKHRPTKRYADLTNGPAKLTQALKVSTDMSTHQLNSPPLELVLQKPIDGSNIVASRRVGITKAAEKLWRFYVKDSAYISRM